MAEDEDIPAYIKEVTRTKSIFGIWKLNFRERCPGQSNKYCIFLPSAVRKEVYEKCEKREGKQENVIMCPACPISLSLSLSLFFSPSRCLSLFLFWMKWRKIPLLICELRLTDVRWWKARCMKTVNENLPLCGCGFCPLTLFYEKTKK